MRLHLLLLAALAVRGVSAAPAEDRVDVAIERGLEYLLNAQKPDGSFDGRNGDTTALPALAAMACMAKGHVPGDAKYGRLIDRALGYILANHDEDGYFGEKSNGKMYAHSIATLLLTEVSGMVSAERQAQIDEVLPKAIKVILDAQNVKKDKGHDGGWRYTPKANDSDTSCSGWALMALRSARLNGAQVPPGAISRAVAYMHRHHNAKEGYFSYQHGNQFTVTLSGAGILCLELCGRHEDPDSLSAARYLMGVCRDPEKGMLKQEYKFYGMYYASQGLFQLGGERWKEFSDWMYSTWVPMQRADGSWNGRGGEDSPVYATSMMILAFAVPYRQLPVYQRDETVDE
ncbi:MAG: terpene cyclase/mutase family protein [Kiritimatiellae bacterium]|nr:terpene cyclase/mutase family protein [Kiritimatiellia bacterium]